MERTQNTLPIFFTSKLFDFLGINPLRRATSQSRIEYLRLTQEEIECLTMAKIIQKGLFWEDLQYVQFDLSVGSLLCVFDDNGRCCRAYFFSNFLPN